MRTALPAALGLSLLLAACGGATPPSSSPAKPSAASASSAASAPASAAAPASKPAAASVAASAKPAASVSTSASPQAASSGAKDKMTIAYTSFTLDQQAPMAAKEEGYFDQNGIDATLVSIGAGSRPEVALMSNQVQLVEGGPEEVTAALQGADLEFVAAADTDFLFTLYSIPSVKTAQDLKGKNIAVTNLTSSTYTAAKLAVESLKLDPSKDVTFLPVNNPPAIFAAMQNGAAQAGSIGSTNIVQVKKAGYNLLVDVAALHEPYPAGWPAVSKKWADAHSDLMSRYMKAYVQGIAYILNNPDGAKQVLAKYSKNYDPAFLNGVYDYVSPHIKKAPYVDVKGIQAVLDELADKDPKAKTADANSMVDNHWVKQLDDSGFINGLYKK